MNVYLPIFSISLCLCVSFIQKMVKPLWQQSFKRCNENVLYSWRLFLHLTGFSNHPLQLSSHLFVGLTPILVLLLKSDFLNYHVYIGVQFISAFFFYVIHESIWGYFDVIPYFFISDFVLP